MKLIEIADLSMIKDQHKKELLSNDSLEQDKKLIIKTLHENCKDVLSVYSSLRTNQFDLSLNLMWRGEGTTVNFYKNNIWKKRKPLYLGKIQHEASIHASYKLGLYANRENSIFCAKASTAADWGQELYAIFPTDGFHVTWFSSKTAHDMEYFYNILEESGSDFIEKLYSSNDPLLKDYSNIDIEEMYELFQNRTDSLPKEIKEKYFDYVTAIMDSHKPVNDNLRKALESKSVNEFLVTGDSYYGLKLKFLSYKDFCDELFSV